jgi:hypothetical protein
VARDKDGADCSTLHTSHATLKRDRVVVFSRVAVGGNFHEGKHLRLEMTTLSSVSGPVCACPPITKRSSHNFEAKTAREHLRDNQYGYPTNLAEYMRCEIHWTDMVIVPSLQIIFSSLGQSSYILLWKC